MQRLLTCLCLAAASACAFAQQCSIEYQRADNMMAAAGRPDGNLGKETLTLQAGETKVFNTDWKYEKRRNDGRNYYGSHLRIMRNTGQRPVKLSLRGNDRFSVGGVASQVIGDRAIGELKPGQSADNLRHDLMEVACAAADKDARASGSTPAGTPNAGAMPPPVGLMARQVTPDAIHLTWQPASNVKEYRVYVSPPPQPQMAGKPGIVGGNGRSYVIPIPRNVAPSTVYQAAIEAVGNDGTVSPRVPFNPVPVQLAGGPAGGPQPGGGAVVTPSGPATSPGAGQQCPPGQFVTGFTSTGALICASPSR